MAKINLGDWVPNGDYESDGKLEAALEQIRRSLPPKRELTPEEQRRETEELRRINKAMKDEVARRKAAGLPPLVIDGVQAGPLTDEGETNAE